MEYDLFDILGDKEDSYTNVIKFLFEKSNKFKFEFIKLIFEEEIADFRNIRIKVRKSFWTISGKNIPDLVLFDNNHLAIVEVKVDAEEGHNQTRRYKNSEDEIKKELNVCENTETKFWLLTKYAQNPDSNTFESLTWKQLLSCLDLDYSDIENSDYRQMAVLLAKQLSNRIRSLDGEPITESDNWIQSVKSEKWSGAINFYKAIEFLKILDNDAIWDYWSHWDNAAHSYMHTVQLYPNKKWLGKNVEKDYREGEDLAEFYDFHFEFKYCQKKDPEKPQLIVRLDYHINPYKSSKDQKSIGNDIYDRCNEKRVGIAKDLLQELSMYEKNIYRKNFLYIVRYRLNIDSGMTVKDVVEKIKPFVDTCISAINKLLKEICK